MPVVFTYDLEGADPATHNRLASLFTRLGWESLGGSAYRYPRLGGDQPTEDWFNHVIPALMLFRAQALGNVTVKKFTLDVQASTGHNPDSGYGTLPQPSQAIVLYAPVNAAFGEQNLKAWLDGVTYPY